MIIFVLPFVVSLILSLLMGKRVIAALAAAKARQPISDDAPNAHKLKHGTPTMGGLMILASTLLAVPFGLWQSRAHYMALAKTANLSNISYDRGSAWLISICLPVVVICLVFLLACGIGILDDLGKAREKMNKAGLSERAKLAFQVIVAGLFVGWLALTHIPGITTAIYVGGHWFDFGPYYYFLAILYICFFGNAVNFTDGLDGLSSGTTLIVCLTLGGIAAATGSAFGIPAFYGAVAGACAGFLWFNAHPAKVFMGDTGSLALGMGIAAAALAAKQELLLLLVGFIYVAEIFSMMIQRYVFKLRRNLYGIEYAKANRVFRRAPLHHHFEELGWPETHVVARFYIAGLIFAALGILAAPYLWLGGSW